MSGRDSPYVVSQEGDRGAIPQQLREVIDLVNSTNQKIEDCAVEWQAKISQAQWKILDEKPVDNKPWEKSILARTYFAEKILDDSFQELLKRNKSFAEHLLDFVALVRGEQPAMNTSKISNAQNQCSNFIQGNEEQVLGHGSPLSSLGIKVPVKNLNTSTEKVESSFTDLIKAKINFDTKFLGFEATMNGDIFTRSNPSLDVCKIYSGILGCEMQGQICNNVKNCRDQKLHEKIKIRRSKRIKQKILNLKRNNLKIWEQNKVAEKMPKESTPDDEFFLKTGGKVV